MRAAIRQASVEAIFSIAPAASRAAPSSRGARSPGSKPAVKASSSALKPLRVKHMAYTCLLPLARDHDNRLAGSAPACEGARPFPRGTPEGLWHPRRAERTYDHSAPVGLAAGFLGAACEDRASWEGLSSLAYLF